MDEQMTVEKNEEGEVMISDRTRRVFGKIRNRFNSVIWMLIRQSQVPGKLDESELESLANSSLMYTIEYYGKARKESTRLKIANRKAKLMTVFVNNFKNAIRTEMYKIGLVEDPYYRREENKGKVGKTVGKKRIPVTAISSLEDKIGSGDSDDEDGLTVGSKIMDDGFEKNEAKSDLVDVLKKKLRSKTDRKIVIMLYKGMEKKQVAKTLKLTIEEVEARLKRVWNILETELGVTLKVKTYPMVKYVSQIDVDHSEAIIDDSTKFARR